MLVAVRQFRCQFLQPGAICTTSSRCAQTYPEHMLLVAGWHFGNSLK